MLNVLTNPILKRTLHYFHSFATFCMSYAIKRIYHKSESGIEKSVRKIAVWHREASDDKRWPGGTGFFYPVLTQIRDYFSSSKN